MTRVSDEDIRAYREDGAICLRGVFEPYWRDLAARGIEYNLRRENWGRRARYYDAGSDNPGFFQDACTWQFVPEYREYVFDAPAAEIAARLTASSQVNIFFDNVMIKAPGNQAPTPWHHDVPFWPVLGSQVCGVWLPLDPVTEENRVRFIRGSHRWGRRFLPMAMVDPDAHYGIDLAAAGYEATPDFDAEIERHEILTWNLEPGDCLVFDGHVVHGAPPNRVDRPRRIFATRWTGDDCVYAGDKHAQIGPPFPHADVKRGAPMDGEVFPVILPR